MRLQASIALFLMVPLCMAEDPKESNLDFFLLEEVFAHVAVGGPWSATLTFVNLGEGDAEFELRFFTPDGQPWLVTTSTGITDSVFTVTLGVLSSFDIELPSLDGEIQTGWAEIDQPLNTVIGGHAVFRDNGGATRPIPFEAVVPLSSFAEGNGDLVPGFWTSILPFDQTRGFNTCVALANSSAFNTANIAIALPQDGTVIALDEIELPARNQTSFCFRGRYSETEGRKGIIVIAREEGDLQLSILGLRFDAQGAFTTFFPMSQL